MTNRLKRFVIPVVAVALSASFAHAQVSGDDVLEQARERGREKAQQTEQTIEIRGLLARLEGRLDETQKLFADLEKRHTSLVEWMESLLDSDDGKRLALNPNAGMQFLAYQEQPVYRLSDLAPKKQTLEELTAFFADPKTSQVGYVPDASRVDQVDDMYLWARDRLARVAETEAWLKQTLAGVDLDADVAAAPTLRERIDAYLAWRHQMWIDQTIAGRQAAEKEAAPQIAENARVVELERALFEAERLKREAQQQLEKERIDFERRLRERDITLKEQVAAAEREYQERLAAIDRENQLAAVERERRDVQADVAARQIAEDAKQIDLVARCHSASVLRDLKPFTSEGLWQPGDKGPNQRADKEPMSYRALLEFGALNPDLDGLQMLLGVANARGCTRANHILYGIRSGQGHPDQTRPKWGYSDTWSKLTEDQAAEVRRIQALLIELGPTLVEEKMLAP